MNRTKRCLVVAVLVGVFAIGMPPPSNAGSAPLRSGTIASGVFTTSPSWECSLMPDCQPWIASGCDPALSGRDPAWLTSIVDVGKLADGRTRRPFAIRAGDPSGVIAGGVTIQFWRKDCVEFRSSMSMSFWSSSWRARRSTTLRVPAGAKWMTVVANDNLNLVWRLG